MSTQWRNGSPGLRRATIREPGFDCRTECKHEEKGDHGWHGDEWIYVVSNGIAAISLSVMTAFFADDEVLNAESVASFRSIFCGRRYDEQLTIGGAMAWHSPFKRLDEEPAECEFIESHQCWGSHESLFAGARFWRMFKGRGDQIERPETFWMALEAKFCESFKLAIEEETVKS